MADSLILLPLRNEQTKPSIRLIMASSFASGIAWLFPSRECCRCARLVISSQKFVGWKHVAQVLPGLSVLFRLDTELAEMILVWEF